MKISDVGLAKIAAWEGFVSMSYIDAAGWPTIGYGHKLTHDESTSGKILIGDRILKYHGGITQDDAKALLRQDVHIAERAVSRLVTLALTQAQFDALVSFVFNVGAGAFQASTLLKYLNGRRSYADIAAQIKRWVYANGLKLKGLERRRAEEAEAFKTV